MRMPRPLLVLAASILIVPHTAAAIYGIPDKRVDPQYDQATATKLESLTVSIHWDKIDVEKALKDLEMKSREADPSHANVHFHLQALKNPSQLKSCGRPILREVTIELESTPINEVLEYICQQTNLVVRIHSNEVILTAWNIGDDEPTRLVPPMKI